LKKQLKGLKAKVKLEGLKVQTLIESEVESMKLGRQL
jgi:hypothetical protein